MPNSEKIRAEEKIRIVELYLSGKIGYREAEKQARVDRKMVARWVSRYKMEGVDGLLHQEHDRAYSKETKLSAVLEYLSGKGSLQEICEKHGVRDTQ